MKVLITGAAGFVGRHFAQALRPAHDVVGIDNGAPCDDPWRHDEDARMFFAVDRQRFDLVIHAAAHVGGRRDIEGRPTFLGAYNLQLDGALFEWALKTKPGRVVYLSSSAVYPVDLQDDYATARELRESDVKHTGNVGAPDATYGLTKLVGERLAAEAQAEGLDVTVVRPFSGYGEDQSTDYPFPSFAARARRRDDPFEIWGDGRQVRDWVHIDDVVAGTLAAVDQGVDEPLNLCTGRATDFNELARMFTAQAGYWPALKHVESAPRGVAFRVGDPTRMLDVYEPRVSLEEGIRRALA